jgi:hypothetical protein
MPINIASNSLLQAIRSAKRGAVFAALGTGLAMSALSTPVAVAQETCSDRLDCESSWVGITVNERAEVFAFAEDYKDFIAKARTELSFVTEAVAFAEENGFSELMPTTRLVPGGKHYEVNRVRMGYRKAFMLSVHISILRVSNSKVAHSTKIANLPFSKPIITGE